MNVSGVLQKLLFVALVQQLLGSTVRLSIQEECGGGTRIGTLADRFPPPYRLLREEFVRVEVTGDLYTTEQRVDREALCPAQPPGEECVISDEAIVSPEQDVVKLVVTVEDVNDNAPHFESSVVRASVAEDAAVGTRVLLDELALDEDAGTNGQLSYRLQGAHGVFGLAQTELSLELVLLAELDREARDSHRMTLVAVDGGAVPLNATAQLIVTVTDANDHCPEFDPPTAPEVSVPGGSLRGTAVVRVKATDLDLGENAKITYSFSPQMSDRAKALFRLDGGTGQISLAGDALATRQEVHVLRVIASAPPCPPTHTEVTVSVLPVAGQAPAIKIKFLAKHKNQTIQLLENEPPTVLALLELGGTSADEGTLSIEPDDRPFTLKRQAGSYLLSTSKPLDYEMCSEYHVAVVSSDALGERMSGGEVIKIVVVDVNDNAPRFQLPGYHVDLMENNEPGASLLRVHATDADSLLNGEISYKLTWNSPGIFRIDEVTGELSVTGSLDREERGGYSLTVLARDRGTPWQQTSVSVSVTVLDQNDNPPAFLSSHFIFFIAESVVRLAQVGKVGVVDADEGANGEVLDVRVLNASAPFAFDPSLGVLRCTGEVDRETQDRYELTLLARDGGAPPLTSSTSVTVFVEDMNDNQPQVVLPSSNLTCLTVSPSTRAGTTVTKIYAIDHDSGVNSEITYHMEASEPAHRSPFRIDPHSGSITLGQQLGGQDVRMHHLLVVVSDRGQPEPLWTAVWVNLLVNETMEPCRVQSVPQTRPPAFLSPVSASVCKSEEACVGKAWQVMLIGLGMMVCSSVALLAAGAVCVRHRNARARAKREALSASELRPLN